MRTTTKSTKSPVKDIEAPMESWNEEEHTRLKSIIHAVSIAQQDFRSHIQGELEKIKNKLYTETPNLMRNIEQQPRNSNYWTSKEKFKSSLFV